MHENPWPRKMRPPRNTSKPSGCSRTSSFATPKPLGPTWRRMPSTAVFRSGLTKKPTTRSTSNGRNSCPNTEPALSDGRGSLLVATRSRLELDGPRARGPLGTDEGRPPGRHRRARWARRSDPHLVHGSEPDGDRDRSGGITTARWGCHRTWYTGGEFD